MFSLIMDGLFEHGADDDQEFVDGFSDNGWIFLIMKPDILTMVIRKWHELAWKLCSIKRKYMIVFLLMMDVSV